MQSIKENIRRIQRSYVIIMLLKPFRKDEDGAKRQQNLLQSVKNVKKIDFTMVKRYNNAYGKGCNEYAQRKNQIKVD